MKNVSWHDNVHLLVPSSYFRYLMHIVSSPRPVLSIVRSTDSLGDLQLKITHEALNQTHIFVLGVLPTRLKTHLMNIMHDNDNELF